MPALLRAERLALILSTCEKHPSFQLACASVPQWLDSVEMVLCQCGPWRLLMCSHRGCGPRRAFSGSVPGELASLYSHLQ